MNSAHENCRRQLEKLKSHAYTHTAEQTLESFSVSTRLGSRTHSAEKNCGFRFLYRSRYRRNKNMKLAIPN